MDPGAGKNGPNGPGDTPGTAGTGRGILSNPTRRTLRAGEIPSTMIECVHAEQCGGCPLIGMDYAQQLTTKRARVVSAIVHYPALELLYTRQVVPGDQIVGYRGRAKLIVSPQGGIGLYGRTGNHDVVDIPNCRVLAPALADVTTALRALIANPPAEARSLLLPYDPQAGGVLRAIDLPRGRHGRRVRVAGAVITRQRPGTAKGFVFLTLEDETGISNIIVRPDLF